MILTPQQLWKDYDRKATPLAVSILSTSESDTARVHYLYFNGEKTQDGVARIFCKLYEPKETAGAPLDSAVIVCDDPEKDVDAFDPSEYLCRGMSVLVIDYAGACEYKSRFTIYPNSIAHEANYEQNEHIYGNNDASPIQSCWYIWATTALRAVTFLEERNYQNIFVLGVGYGGAQVWKTCYFDHGVRAGAVIFSTPPPSDMTLGYRASLAAISYANLAKSPVLIQITSNEQNGTLDIMNELYLASREHGSYLSISERANRVIEPDRSDNAAKWFLAKKCGETLPAPPALTAKGSQNQLYCEIKVDDSEHVVETSLFVAHAQKNSAFRNWRNQTIQMVGEGEYLAKIPVLIPNEPVYAFVNVRYLNGFCFSSAVECILPASLGVAAEASVFKRLIYDNSMGLSDWLILHNPGGKQVKPSVEKGPFDLEGIRSPSNILTTFRLADPQFRGKPDSVLQLSLYSGSAQTVLFHITTTEKLTTYTAKREFFKMDAWSKLTLSPNDFKGTSTSLLNWSDILTFEIESTDKLLISSMLWV